MTATHEFVVPKSIPIIFAMSVLVYKNETLFFCCVSLSIFMPKEIKRV